MCGVFVKEAFVLGSIPILIGTTSCDAGFAYSH